MTTITDDECGVILYGRSRVRSAGAGGDISGEIEFIECRFFSLDAFVVFGVRMCEHSLLFVGMHVLCDSAYVHKKR